MSAGNTIAKGSVVLTANADPLGAGLAKAEHKVRDFKKNLDNAGPKDKGGGGLMGFATGPWGLALAAGAVGVHKLIGAFGDLSESIDAASKSSATLGIDMSTFQGLSHAADLSGVSVEQLEVGLGKFRREVDGPLDEALYSLADRLEGIEEPGERARLLVESFGKSGLKMAPMFADGREGLKGMVDEAGKLGIALSNADGKKIEAANDSITRVKSAVKGLMNQVLISAAPIVDKIGQVATKIVVFLRPAVEWYGRYMDRLWTIAVGVWDAVGEAISDVIEAIGELGGGMFDWVGTLPTIEDVVTAVFRTLGTTASYAWDTVKAGAGTGLVALSAVVKGIALVADAFGDFARLVSEMPGMEWAGRIADEAKRSKAGLDILTDGMDKKGWNWIDGWGQSAKQFNLWLDRIIAKKNGLDKDGKKPLGEGLANVAPKFAAAIEAGSKEAYSMEVRNKFGEKAGKNPVETLLEKNQRIALETNTRLRAIERSLDAVEKF